MEVGENLRSSARWPAQYMGVGERDARTPPRRSVPPSLGRFHAYYPSPRQVTLHALQPVHLRPARDAARGRGRRLRAGGPRSPTYGGVNVRHGADFYQFDGGDGVSARADRHVPLDSVAVRRRRGRGRPRYPRRRVRHLRRDRRRVARAAPPVNPGVPSRSRRRRFAGETPTLPNSRAGCPRYPHPDADPLPLERLERPPALHDRRQGAGRRRSL